MPASRISNPNITAQENSGNDSVNLFRPPKTIVTDDIEIAIAAM